MPIKTFFQNLIAVICTGSSLCAFSQQIFTVTKIKFGPDSFRVYKPSNDVIKVYQTTNGGKSWALETAISVGQKVDRIHVINDAHKDAKLLITEAGDNTLDVGKRDVFIGSLKSR